MSLTFEEEFKIVEYKVRIEEYQKGRFCFINSNSGPGSKHWIGLYIKCKQIGQKVPFNKGMS